MIVVGVLAAAVLTIPGVLPAVAVVLLIQLQILLDCSDGELARWREQYSPAGIYLDRFGHYLTETLLPIGLGIRADGGWDSIGGYTTLGLLAAVLALLVRTESALVAVARLEAGKPAADDTAAVAAPRASGLARLRRALGFFPFFRAFVAIEASLLALGARRSIDAFVRGDARHARARHRARPDRGDHRGRAPGRDPRVEPPAVTFGCVLLTMGRRPEDLRRALDSLLAQRGVELDIVVVGNDVGADGAARRACAASARPRTSASRPGATSASRTTSGELLFFLDDDASLAVARRARGGRAALRGGPGARAAAAARRPARRRRLRARLGAAAARRGPLALERHHRGVGGRGGDAARGLRRGRRLAGRTSASCTRGSTSGGG